MDKDSLTLHLRRDMRLFVRRQAARAANGGELDSTAEPVLSAEYVELLIHARRRELWTRALQLLQAAGWLGCEIFAAIDVGTRHRLDSEEADQEIVGLWTHISPRRWRRCVAQWRRRQDIGQALVDVALELDADDSECKNACLAMYDRPSLWMRLRRRPRAPYATLKRVGSDSFVAVRLR